MINNTTAPSVQDHHSPLPVKLLQEILFSPMKNLNVYMETTNHVVTLDPIGPRHKALPLCKARLGKTAKAHSTR